MQCNNKIQNNNINHNIFRFQSFDTQSDAGSTSKSTGIPDRKKRAKLTAVPTDDCKSIALKGMQRALEKMEEVDSFQVFGNFVAAELRKISNESLANQVQRKITRFVMDCMDEVDASTSKITTNTSQTFVAAYDQSKNNLVISWLMHCEDPKVQNIV